MIYENLYYIPESLYQGALSIANRTQERQTIGVSYAGRYNPKLTIEQNADRYRADLRVGRFCRWTLPAEEGAELMARITVKPEIGSNRGAVRSA